MRTLPFSAYVDPAVLACEREVLFAPAWQYAGLVPEPGAYLTCRVDRVPIVVVRDRNGALRAFVNVCRHRGAEVVSGEGRCTTLQCHYHAWTYGLDGALRAAPRAEAGFDRSELSLLPAAVDTWGPFVFVNADPDAAPLAQTLGPLPDIARSRGLDLGALAFHHRVHYAVDANWKVCVENYLECYHCAVAHPGFSAVVDVREDAYELEAHPTFASHFAPARGGDGMGQFHLVWPTLKVNVMPGPPNLSIGPMTPVSPGRTEGFLDYFFAPGATPEWIAEFLVLDDQVGAEDVVLVESVQRGMASGALAHGRLLLPGERLIAAFQRWVSDALAREPQLPGA
jgi:phenylpropionate dioxygenase-like ring-hydroxylating dioxygenase large terminal subunit